jgi:hypothetical protein
MLRCGANLKEAGTSVEDAVFCFLKKIKELFRGFESKTGRTVKVLPQKQR